MSTIRSNSLIIPSSTGGLDKSHPEYDRATLRTDVLLNLEDRVVVLSNWFFDNCQLVQNLTSCRGFETLENPAHCSVFIGEVFTEKLEEFQDQVAYVAQRVLSQNNPSLLTDPRLLDRCGYYAFDLFGSVMTRSENPVQFVEYLHNKKKEGKHSVESHQIYSHLLGQVSKEQLIETLVGVAQNRDGLELFIEAFDSHPEFSKISDEDLSVALLESAKDFDSFKLILETFECSSLLRDLTPDHLGQCLASLIQSSPERFSEIMALFENHPALKEINAEHMGQILAAISKSRENIREFPKYFYLNVNYGSIKAEHFAIALQNAASTFNTLDIFTTTFRAHFGFRNISKEALEEVLGRVLYSEDALRMFVDTCSPNPHFDQISGEAIGKTIVLFSENFESLSLFLQLFEDHPNLRNIPANKIGVLIERSTYNFQDFPFIMEQFNDYPAFRDLSPEFLGRILVRVSKNYDQLKLFLRHVQELDAFSEIPRDPFIQFARDNSLSDFRATKLFAKTFWKQIINVDGIKETIRSSCAKLTQWGAPAVATAALGAFTAIEWVQYNH